MSTKIKNLPQLRVDEIRGYLKVPTGGMGDVSVTVQGIVDWIKSLDLFTTNKDFKKHTENIENPHNVTKQQIGLGNVDNTSDLDKPISNAQNIVNNSLNNEITNHIRNKLNPHNVTKQQIGLGNVDNTSDLDKPISIFTKRYVDDRFYGAANSYTNAYSTVDEALLHKDEWLSNSSILITNDGDKSGLYLWDGINLTKSDYDPLKYAKEYTDLELDKFGEFKNTAQFTSNWNTLRVNGIYKSNDGDVIALGSPDKKRNVIMTHKEGDDGNSKQECTDLTTRISYVRFRDETFTFTDWMQSDEVFHEGFYKSKNKQTYLDGDSVKRFSTSSELWTTVFGLKYPKSSDVNDAYRLLQEQHPDYITSDLLGIDESGEQIMEFTFRPPQFRWANPITPFQNAHPTIVIVTGMHAGTEKNAVATTLLFFQDLCNDWKNNSKLSELRWGCNFVVVPCLNPFGYNNTSRYTKDGVELNHNFPIGWETSTSELKGSSPLNQVASQVGVKLAERHPTAKTMIDFHSHDNDYYTWVGTRSSDALAIQKNMLREHQAWIYRNAFRDDNENTALVSSTGTVVTGMATYWTKHFNRKGFLLEMQERNIVSRERARVLGYNALLTLIHENWKEESIKTGFINDTEKWFTPLTVRDGESPNYNSVNRIIDTLIKSISVENAQQGFFYRLSYFSVSDELLDASGDLYYNVRLQFESIDSEKYETNSNQSTLVTHDATVYSGSGELEIKTNSTRVGSSNILFKTTINLRYLNYVKNSEIAMWHKSHAYYCYIIPNTNYTYNSNIIDPVNFVSNNIGDYPISYSSVFYEDPKDEESLLLGSPSKTRGKFTHNATNKITANTVFKLATLDNTNNSIVFFKGFPNVYDLQVNELNTKVTTSSVSVQLFTPAIQNNPFGFSDFTYRSNSPTYTNMVGHISGFIKVDDENYKEKLTVSLRKITKDSFESNIRQDLGSTIPLKMSKPMKMSKDCIINSTDKYYSETVLDEWLSGYWVSFEVNINTMVALYPNQQYKFRLYRDSYSNNERSIFDETGLILTSGVVSLSCDISPQVNYKYNHLLRSFK